MLRTSTGPRLLFRKRSVPVPTLLMLAAPCWRVVLVVIVLVVPDQPVVFSARLKTTSAATRADRRTSTASAAGPAASTGASSVIGAQAVANAIRAPHAGLQRKIV